MAVFIRRASRVSCPLAARFPRRGTSQAPSRDDAPIAKIESAPGASSCSLWSYILPLLLETVFHFRIRTTCEATRVHTSPENKTKIHYKIRESFCVAYRDALTHTPFLFSQRSRDSVARKPQPIRILDKVATTNRVIALVARTSRRRAHIPFDDWLSAL